jgi:hypothetical protein
MKSPKSRAGKLGCEVTSTGESTILPIGAKSPMGSNPAWTLAAGMVTCVPSKAVSKV